MTYDTAPKIFMNTLDFEKKQKAVSQLLKAQLNNGKQLRFQVTSNSMKPFIRAGDEVIIKKTKPETLLPGDIILFEKGNNFCTHRFIRKIAIDDTTQFITKGDKFIGFDIPFTVDKILGKVEAIERSEGLIDLSLPKFKRLNQVLGKIFNIYWYIFQFGKCIKIFFSN